MFNKAAGHSGSSANLSLLGGTSNESNFRLEFFFLSIRLPQRTRIKAHLISSNQDAARKPFSKIQSCKTNSFFYLFIQVVHHEQSTRCMLFLTLLTDFKNFSIISVIHFNVEILQIAKYQRCEITGSNLDVLLFLLFLLIHKKV